MLFFPGVHFQDEKPKVTVIQFFVMQYVFQDLKTNKQKNRKQKTLYMHCITFSALLTYVLCICTLVSMLIC